jgi:hypothetical protein
MSFLARGIAPVRCGVISDVGFRRGDRRDLRALWCTAGSRREYGQYVTFGVDD